MRTALLGLATLGAAFVLDAAPASAQGYPVYPWCAAYGGRGGTNCYFSTFWQCQQAISGVGGSCYQNPFYGYAGAGQRPSRRSYQQW